MSRPPASNDSEGVDQVWIGWRRDRLGVLASSLPTLDEVHRWQRILEGHARLRRHGRQESGPAQALSYFEAGGRAVVLRRWGDGGEGRNNSLALIGSPDALDVFAALGLGEGLDWNRVAAAAGHAVEEQARLPRFPASGIIDFAEPHMTSLQRAARKIQPLLLKNLLAQFVTTPDVRLTILKCPDEERVTLMWALAEIGSQYLQALGRAQRQWSFSTYEIEHGDGVRNRPEFVFMTARPTDPAPGRRVVDLSIKPLTNSEIEIYVDELVKQYSDNRMLFQSDVIGVASWVQYADPRDSQNSTPGDRPPEVKGTSTEPPQPAAEPSPTDRRGFQPAESQPFNSPQLEDGYAATPASAPQPALSPKGPNSPDALDVIIENLRRPNKSGDVNTNLAALLHAAKTSAKREHVRNSLGMDGYLELVSSIMRQHLVDLTDRFQDLLNGTFGSNLQDLGDPPAQKFARELLSRTEQSQEFVRLLVVSLDTHQPSVLPAADLANLWRRQHGLATISEQSGPGPRNGAQRLGRTNRTRPPAAGGKIARSWPTLISRRSLIVTFLILTTALLIFLLGRCSATPPTSAHSLSTSFNPWTQTVAATGSYLL